MAFAAGGSAISIWQKFARRGKPPMFYLLEVTLKLGFRLNSMISFVCLGYEEASKGTKLYLQIIN